MSYGELFESGGHGVEKGYEDWGGGGGVTVVQKARNGTLGSSFRAPTLPRVNSLLFFLIWPNFNMQKLR